MVKTYTVFFLSRIRRIFAIIVEYVRFCFLDVAIRVFPLFLDVKGKLLFRSQLSKGRYFRDLLTTETFYSLLSFGWSLYSYLRNFTVTAFAIKTIQKQRPYFLNVGAISEYTLL